ncbi:YdbH domain-containing protein [Parvibaculum sp.]|uniref:YdbH domain-containing protein n=1 Tax=Parvibaculum sp. TaxID=2024848 RepID=UPI00391AF539
MLKGRWGRLTISVLLLLAAVSVAVVWVWQQRRGLAEQMIAQALAERGIAPVAFTVSFIGLRSISLSDVVVGDPSAPDASIDSVTVSYSLGELMSGHVRSIDVGEAGVRMTISEDGLSLGALDPVLKGEGGGDMQLPPVEISSLSAEIKTPQGALSVSGPLSIAPDGEALAVSTNGVLIAEEAEIQRISPLHAVGSARIASAAISIAAEVSVSQGGQPGISLMKIEGEYDNASKRGVLRGEGAISLERDGMTLAKLVPALAPYYIDLTGAVSYRGEALYDGEALSVSGEADMQSLALRQTAAGDARMSGKVKFEATTGGSTVPLRFDLSNVRVEDMSRPERFAPVTIEGPVTVDKGRVDTRLVVRSALPAIRGTRLSNINAHYDIAKGEGGIIADGDMALAPGKLELQTVLPFLKDRVTQTSGGVSYSAQAKFSHAGLATSGRATLKDLGLVTSSASARGISGVVNLGNLLPPMTSGVQTLTIRELDAGVPLERGTVSFELDRTGLRLIDAAWPFADGRLVLASRDGSALADDAAFLLTVENVDLGILLKIADIPGLRATGHIAGSIPVVIRNGDPVLVDGSLSAQENGIIVYQSEAGDAAQTEQTKLLTDALKNFHYTALSGGLSGNANGEVVLRLSLRGSNPDLYEGYPFAINVNVEGSLADLFRRGTVGFRPLELIKQHPEGPGAP